MYEFISLIGQIYMAMMAALFLTLGISAIRTGSDSWRRGDCGEAISCYGAAVFTIVIAVFFGVMTVKMIGG